MRSIKALICVLVFAMFGIVTTTPLQAKSTDTLPFETVAQNNVRSGWYSDEPGIVIVATPDELAKIYGLVVPDDYQQLKAIDYDRSFVIAVFQGLGSPQDEAPEIQIEQVDKQDAMIQITASTHPVPLDISQPSKSPYQIIKIEKESGWGIEGTFSLQLDEMSIVTETHYIPNDYLPFETVIQSPPNGIDGNMSLWESAEAGTIIIATTDELSNLNSSIMTETMQTLQAVDYDKQFIIVLFQGVQGSLGYAIEIEEIRHRFGEIEIDALLTEPSEGEDNLTVQTSPYHVVKVDKKAWWSRELSFTILSGEQSILTQTHAIPNNDLVIETLRNDNGGELWWTEESPRLIVANTVRDADELKTLVDIESIDYSQYFVVALFHGQRSSGGYEINLAQLRREGNRLSIHNNVRSPFVGDQVPTVLTSPYHIVKIPRSGHEWDREMSVDALFNGTQVLTETYYLSSPSKMITLEKTEGGSGWSSPDPHLEIITALADLSNVESFVSTEALAVLQVLDYSKQYAAIVFQGQKTSTEYGIEIEQINRNGNQVTFQSVATTPDPGSPVGAAITSPYHLVEIDNVYEQGREIDFILSIDGEHILTQTHSIPDLFSLPSILQGNFYPLTDQLGYEIVLENVGEQTAENARLAVRAGYDGVDYDTDNWQCDTNQPSQECQQSLGDLAPGQVVTRTFSFYTLALPFIRSIQSCGIRVEFEEPVVTAMADNMAVHHLRGTGESVFSTVFPGQPCSELVIYLPVIVR